MQIVFNQVKADYQLGPIRTANIINEVNLLIADQSFTAVIGPTGAGKSSLLKMINGLLLPSAGSIQVGEYSITPSCKKQTLAAIRKRVGMVFQFPEHQLFAETVEQDIGFGPTNFGFSREETRLAVIESMGKVGLDPALLQRSPFSLSGGQQRRVAIAGIIATKPDVLVLDEPGAGLDPEGKREILTMIQELHDNHKLTTVLVTHDMDDVVAYADNVVVMANGQVMCQQKVEELFADKEALVKWKIDLPEPLRIQRCIEEQCGRAFSSASLTLEALADLLLKEYFA
ncbi:energy-coupling factor transport system ATP-binding protein [Amphibacillus marinus]|uniref:Energy-coupling factor transporter ATP-binding protein EcfA2 n=1 Tax=Amphibacillus marinus TaxID=872970 RepID=A0A1H8TKK7_9BACI|nr:energy-coupling factor transporter ATPase [Amphibacillus marinus]SEO91609.1 energy-coupling factor transport system ATP-binding protein [Amphibacillus marinus]